jgi:simple sugar transport system permease protein
MEARKFPALPRIIWPLAALALIVLFNAFFTPHFFELNVVRGRVHGYLIDILHNGAAVMLLSIGMTLVIATGGIDLSVGAVMAIAGTTAAVLIVRPEGSPLSRVDVHGSMTAVICIALLVATLAGLWNGALRAFLGIQPIIATLILMVSGRGIAQLLANGQIVTFDNPTLVFLAGGSLLGVPFTIVQVAIVAGIAATLTRATALGLFIESVGSNPTASRYCGVNARLVQLAVYTFSGFCAGVAGLIKAADIKGADANTSGLFLELDAILAVSIGGTALTGGRFSLLGSLIGALVIQLLTTTFLAHDIPRAIDLMVKAGVVIVVCLLQSETFRSKLLRKLRRRA